MRDYIYVPELDDWMKLNHCRLNSLDRIVLRLPRKYSIDTIATFNGFLNINNPRPSASKPNTIVLSFVMIMWTSTSIIDLIFIPLYAVLLFPNIFLCFKHGIRKHSGYLFLVIVCCGEIRCPLYKLIRSQNCWQCIARTRRDWRIFKC